RRPPPFRGRYYGVCCTTRSKCDSPGCRPERLPAARRGLMFEIFGIPSQALFGQLLLGLINGSFYALLSLGLAVIFGMLNIINFTHGAQYMMGAFAAYLLLQNFGLNYWAALVIAPILVGATGVLIERLFLQHLRKLDPLYGLLLTF